MARLLESSRCLVRMLHESIDQVIAWPPKNRSDYAGSDIANLGIVPASMRSGEENKEPRCIGDRRVRWIQDRLDQRLFYC